MIKTFTQNDVIRYVYDETSYEENELIAHFLLTDADLQAFYYEVLEMKRRLDKVQLAPPDRVVHNIMAYSRSYRLHAVD
jgi:hypothetical protein